MNNLILKFVILLLFLPLITCSSTFIESKSKEVKKFVGEYTLYQATIFEIMRREKFMPKPYYCPAGKYTVGFGCVIDTKREQQLYGQGITYQQAKNEVALQLDNMRKSIEKDAPYKYSLNEQTGMALLFLAMGKERFFKKRPAIYHEYLQGRGIRPAIWRSIDGYHTPSGKRVRVPSMYINRCVELLIFMGKPCKVLEERIDEDVILVKKQQAQIQLDWKKLQE